MSLSKVLRVLMVLPVLMVPGAAQEKAPETPEKKEEKKDEKKWDVNEPLGPTTKLEFETSEGTWMNVDVSPDGRRSSSICSAISTSCRSEVPARRPPAAHERTGLRHAAAVQP